MLRLLFLPRGTWQHRASQHRLWTSTHLNSSPSLKARQRIGRASRQSRLQQACKFTGLCARVASNMLCAASEASNIAPCASHLSQLPASPFHTQHTTTESIRTPNQCTTCGEGSASSPSTGNDFTHFILNTQ